MVFEKSKGRKNIIETTQETEMWKLVKVRSFTSE